MSHNEHTTNRPRPSALWNVATAALLCTALVGCGPPMLSQMHPNEEKTSVWVGVRGPVPGWDVQSIQDAITGDGAVPLVQTFPAGASDSVVDKALGTYNASLYIWVQDEPMDAGLARVIATHPTQKFELVAPESSALTNEAKAVTPDGVQSGYLLGYTAGLLSTDIAAQQVGILANTKNAVEQNEIKAMFTGLYSAGNTLPVVQANLTPASMNGASSQGGPGNPNAVNSANTVQGQGSAGATNQIVPGLGGVIPTPITKVVVAFRPLTAAEWTEVYQNGILVLSLVGDTKHSGLVAEPITPPFSAVEGDVQALVAGTWTAKSESALVNSPVWFDPSAFTVPTVTALASAEQTVVSSSQILQRWNALPSTLRSSWAVWVNTGA